MTKTISTKLSNEKEGKNQPLFAKKNPTKIMRISEKWDDHNDVNPLMIQITDGVAQPGNFRSQH